MLRHKVTNYKILITSYFLSFKKFLVQSPLADINGPIRLDRNKRHNPHNGCRLMNKGRHEQVGGFIFNFESFGRAKLLTTA